METIFNILTSGYFWGGVSVGAGAVVLVIARLIFACGAALDDK